MEVKDIEKLAELSKIELTDTEKLGLLKDLDSILDYVKQITEVSVEDINAEYKNRNVWREDLPASGGQNNSNDFSKEIIREQFPDSQDGFVKVKKIM